MLTFEKFQLLFQRRTLVTYRGIFVLHSRKRRRARRTHVLRAQMCKV